MDFNNFQYKAKEHVIDRYIQRLRINRDDYLKKHKGDVPKNEKVAQRIFEAIVKQEVLHNLVESQVVIETNTHRYVSHKGLLYPCQKIIKDNNIVYLARTVLTKRMVEKKFDDLILEKYVES